MIRYPITKDQIETLIKKENKNWLEEAAKRTKKFRDLGQYKESSSMWHKVKPVYMRLQGCKCVFCERKLESIKVGKGEQAVEHFRPKGRVKAWPVPKEIKSHNIPFTPVPNVEKGYHLLSYHPFNYAAACIPCNSVLKNYYFPIAGVYDLDADDPALLKNEKAYLIYPIGSLDDDPETLIEFIGASPRPKVQRGHQRNRALVTIAFFKLDDPTDRNLYEDRAYVIMALFPWLQKTQTGSAEDRKAARATVDGFLHPQKRHQNCARSFKRLFESNPTEAQAIYDNAVKFIDTIS